MRETITVHHNDRTITVFKEVADRFYLLPGQFLPERIFWRVLSAHTDMCIGYVQAKVSV